MLDPRVAGLAAQIAAESRDTREHLTAVGGDYRAEVLQAQEVLRDRLARRLEELRNLAAAETNAATDAATLVGDTLAEISAELATVREEVELGRSSYLAFVGDALADVHTELRTLNQALGASSAHTAEDGPEQLDAESAAFLNLANSHQGLAARRNLWFNWPVTLAYEEGGVRIGEVNERIVEVPYAFQALAPLDLGSRVLDVGATESTVALSLASLGFDVTALDPRPYPFEHPNLSVALGSAESWTDDEPFDAVLCISTLEHLGSGEYGQAEDAGADSTALEHLRTLLRDDGLLVLTTPVGAEGGSTGARVYNRARLDELLARWRIADFTIVDRAGTTAWVLSDAPRGTAVALVTARK